MKWEQRQPRRAISAPAQWGYMVWKFPRHFISNTSDKKHIYPKAYKATVVLHMQLL